jgi:autotransporter-associated beta strand protein
LGSNTKTGTIEYTGATASSTMPLSLASGGTGGIQVDSGAANLTLSGGISGSGALNKSGTGGLILSTANTYGGGTTVSAGTLYVTNTTGSATGAGAVTVNSGAQLIGAQAAGQGSFTGTLNVNGGGSVSAFESSNQTAGNAYTLSTGALNLDNDSVGGTILNFTLTGTPNGITNPALIAVNGGVNVVAGTTVKLFGTASVGTYDLMSYTGGLTNFGNLTLDTSNLPASPYTYSLTNAAGQLDLTVNGSITWTGQTGGNGLPDSSWNTTGSTNWAAGATVTSYVDNTLDVVRHLHEQRGYLHADQCRQQRYLGHHRHQQDRHGHGYLQRLQQLHGRHQCFRRHPAGGHRSCLG